MRGAGDGDGTYNRDRSVGDKSGSMPLIVEEIVFLNHFRLFTQY